MAHSVGIVSPTSLFKFGLSPQTGASRGRKGISVSFSSAGFRSIQAVQENGGPRRLVDIIRVVPELSRNYFRSPSRRALFGGISLLGGFYVAQTISLSFGALGVNDVIAAVLCVLLTEYVTRFYYSRPKDGAILAWKFNLATNCFEPAALLKGHTIAVVSLLVGANRLYSGSMDNSTRVWNLETLQCIQMLTEHTSFVMSLVCWDQFLFSCSLDKTIMVWFATESGNLEVTYTHNEKHGCLRCVKCLIQKASESCCVLAMTTLSGSMICHRSLRGLKFLPNRRFEPHS